jgi:hypothetical protein
VEDGGLVRPAARSDACDADAMKNKDALAKSWGVFLLAKAQKR